MLNNEKNYQQFINVFVSEISRTAEWKSQIFKTPRKPLAA